MPEPDDIGGRLAANFRRGNIAEGVAAQMLRPVAAIAPVAHEEDYGLDLFATLLRREGRCLVAEDSFVVQVKIHTAARFTFKGEGISWFRRLRLPYFPMVVDLTAETAFLFTLNRWHRVIYPCVVDKYVFVLDDDMENDPGDEFFSLGEPLMQWSVSDSMDPAFPRWAYSVLKPAIQIETSNWQYGPMWRFTELVGGPYLFANRNEEGYAVDPPRTGSILNISPGDRNVILESLKCVIGPFANVVANTPFPDDRSKDLIHLREVFRRLGFDPDQGGEWDTLAHQMAEGARQGGDREHSQQSDSNQNPSP